MKHKMLLTSKFGQHSIHSLLSSTRDTQECWLHPKLKNGLYSRLKFVVIINHNL